MVEKAEKKIYKCSVCHDPGHNKQNCPTAKLLKEHKADQFIAVLESMPMKECLLSIAFIWAWKEAYGDEFKLTDILLGIIYGFTIPDALQGGIVANTYACGALSILMAGLDGPQQWLAKFHPLGTFQDTLTQEQRDEIARRKAMRTYAPWERLTDRFPELRGIDPTILPQP